MLYRKKISAYTVDNATWATPAELFMVDLQNLGDADATITNADGSTWLLTYGSRQQFALGGVLDSMSINATGTKVQVLYSF